MEWDSLPRGEREGNEEGEREEGQEQGKKEPEGGRDYVPSVKASWKNKSKQETSSHRSLLSQMICLIRQSLEQGWMSKHKQCLIFCKNVSSLF